MNSKNKCKYIHKINSILYKYAYEGAHGGLNAVQCAEKKQIA